MKNYQTGRRFDSTADLFSLVGQIHKMMIEVDGLIRRRGGTFSAYNDEVKSWMICIRKMQRRFLQGHLHHFEGEESIVIALGQWLIVQYAEITNTEGAVWGDFNPAEHFRKSTIVYN